MGLFTNLLSFGAGYAAGVKIGMRPVDATRTLVAKARTDLSTATTRATEMREALARSNVASRLRAPGTSVDVREVREVMTSSPETITLTSPIRQAAEVMERSDIGSVIVVANTGDVRGIVTDRDIALRVVAEARDPATTVVSDVMTPSPASIEPTAGVQEAVALMRQHDVRRLPVVEGGRAVGVVALADISTSSEAGALLEDLSAAPPNN